MHEFGIVQNILEKSLTVSKDAGAERIVSITVELGEMVEAVEDSLQFAFGILSEGTIAEGAELVVETIAPRSHCADCGRDFEHDRYHLRCPHCESLSTQLLAGREMNIRSIDIDVPEDEENQDGR